MSHHLFEQDGVQVSRFEDTRLITGAGRYTADRNLPNQLHAAFVRADRAHARIVSIDVSQALAHPGVAGVYTGEDAVAAGYVKAPTLLNYPGKNGMQVTIPERPALAHGRVRFVGEPVVLVVASSALVAQDAAELVFIDYEDLLHAVDPEEALEPGAAQVHDEVPGNMPFEYEAGDVAATEAAFAQAAHVTRIQMVVSRVIANPLETRACLVDYAAAEDAYTVHTCTQGVNYTRRQLASYTQLPENRFRIVAQDVGGGFGQRSVVYPEYVALLLAAKGTGRPVKWVSSRTEAFLSDAHGRGNRVKAELAMDGKGRFLAIRLDWVADMGAYLAPTGASHIRNPATLIVGVYGIPQAFGHWRLAFTNTSPVNAYRGAGRPDIAYVVERLVDNAAAEMGLDAAEIRRRNFIPPEAFPYKTPLGYTYENADLPGLMAKALELADWDGFAARRAASEARGRLRGRGIATVIENTGGGAFPKDEVEMEVDVQGRVTLYTVTHSQGQGHETSFAMLAAQALQIPAEQVKVCQGLPEHELVGNHSSGSRSMVGAGGLCHAAGQKLVQQARALVAQDWGVDAAQVSYSGGVFQGAGAGQRSTLADLASRHTLAVRAEGKFGSTFPNGCHIAEVEIDPSTGVTKIVSYAAVDDCGLVVNHAIVEGQLHGAVAQGAGQILGEEIVYDRETGQLLTGSFSDYYMPRSDLLPAEIPTAEHPTASKVNPLGIKGAGEAGCTGSLPGVANAVVDALRHLGIGHIDMPMTPAKLWTAITLHQQAGNTR